MMLVMFLMGVLLLRFGQVALATLAIFRIFGRSNATIDWGP